MPCGNHIEQIRSLFGEEHVGIDVESPFVGLREWVNPEFFQSPPILRWFRDRHEVGTDPLGVSFHQGAGISQQLAERISGSHRDEQPRLGRIDRVDRWLPFHLGDDFYRHPLIFQPRSTPDAFVVATQVARWSIESGNRQYRFAIDMISKHSVDIHFRANGIEQIVDELTPMTGVKFTQFLSEQSMVYAGKINTLDDFKQPITGAGTLNGFQNTALMLNPIYARTVPYSTFGAGFAYLENMEPLFAAAVFDTNNTPTVSGFDTFFDNGTTVFAQLNLQTSFFGLPGHQGISGTYSSGTYTDLTPSAYLDPIEGLVILTAPKSGSWCLAYNFDQAVYVSQDDPQRKWGLFSNLGIADNNPSPINWFASAGISGTSPFAARKADTFGVGYFYVGVSDPLKSLAPNLFPLQNENGVELYYNVQATPWCQITPDLQVIDPFRERADSSLLFGLRAKIDF